MLPYHYFSIHWGFCLDMRKNLFIVKVTKYWQKGDQRGCRFSIFGNNQKLTACCAKQSSPSESNWAESWTRWPPEVPSNLNHSLIPKYWNYIRKRIDSHVCITSVSQSEMFMLTPSLHKIQLLQSLVEQPFKVFA